MGRGLARRLAQLVFAVVVQGLILFLASGELSWLAAWVYLASYVVLIAVNAAILLPRDPDLIAERSEVKADTKAWDRVLIVLMTLFSFGTLLVAGLDRRQGWTAISGRTIPGTGFVLYVAGFALVSWAMLSNRFFASVVRIQKERGHTVAQGGPYSLVRHPGYLGMIVSITGAALLLASLWALVAVGAYVVTLIVRAALEDRTLRRELPGYEDYAARVRYRLLPRIW